MRILLKLLHQLAAPKRITWPFRAPPKPEPERVKHLITSAIEHHAVLDTFKYLAKKWL
jgi:hypothetical protein